MERGRDELRTGERHAAKATDPMGPDACLVQGVHTLMDAARVMRARGTSLLPIVDVNGATLGSLTEGAVVDAAERVAGVARARILIHVIVGISEANVDVVEELNRHLNTTKVQAAPAQMPARPAPYHNRPHVAPEPSALGRDLGSW